MKKILTFCILILLVPGLFGFTAHAYAYQPVKAEIEVEVTLGGTAAIIPNVNCPIPEKDYTVKTVPDDRDIEFDDTVYNIKFYVTDNDGRLQATTIASKGEEKYSRLIFVNTEKGGDEPTTNPTDSSYKGDSPLDKNRNPKTSDDTRMEMYFLFAIIASAGLLAHDDTRMEIYFLFAIIASAGLLALSIVYLIDTQKMINKKNKEEN